MDFFLSYQTRCKSIGIEYDDRIYAGIIENKKSAVSGSRTEFVLGSAEEYEVPEEADRFYFFNPFSVTLLRKVMNKIEESYYKNPREILFFFYYPSDEYVAYLMTKERVFFADEIDCRDLFEGDNKREKVLIFEYE